MKSFISNYSRRYNLDQVLAEYEAEHGAIEIGDDEEEEKKVKKIIPDKKNIKRLLFL